MKDNRYTPPENRRPPRRKSAPSGKRERRRLVRLVISGCLLVVVVAVKLLMPDVMQTYRDKVLHLMDANTDFVSAFSAVGRAFSSEGTIRETLTDAYTAVFGQEDAVEAAAPADTAAELFSGVYGADNLPQQAELWQQVLGFSYQSPLEGILTSAFGYRIHPIEGENRFHYGVDIGAEEGAAIAAFADGTVGVVGQSSDLGTYLTVNHASGYSTLYAHCSWVCVSAGQTVCCGDIIAQAGQTGRATGPHLHFELHRGETYINPIYYV